MNIAAHTAGGYGGVPQAVGAEFHAADKGTGILKRGKDIAHMSKALRRKGSGTGG